MKYADVILPVPFESFTYAVPPAMQGRLAKGSRVLVELGKTKQYAGIVTRLHDQQPPGVQMKDVLAVLDERPIVTEEQFRFWQWIADYYMSPLGDVFKAAFPGRLKKDDTPKTERTRKPLAQRLGLDEGEGPTKTLSPAQQTAYDQILASWADHDITLLHGVTSSGKTEIYIQLIQRTLDSGKQVLYLLPEIALTTQITDRLRRVFGSRLGVYHSKFTDARRAEVYRNQLSDSPFQVILGVRSSVFLPFQNLGLVIVDEEHESSYKQQEPAPRYHARNAALMLARQFGAKCLLGTATPSLETYSMARKGAYGYVSLTQRFADMQLPEVEVVDIKRLKFQKRMKGSFSPRLIEEIGAALERHEQAILFQNRRGFSSFIQCNECGWVPRCEHCDVSLTFHKRTRQMACHYCGAVYALPLRCPECGGLKFSTIGVGTERVEEQIAALFPQAKTMRLDLDTAKSRTAYERIIDGFSAHESDILIGTQMVTKGLDFDHVSVVGILDADTMLNQPDFRSYERAFQMLAQVAGRAGRKGHRGKVVLQTRSADSPIIQQVVDNAYAAMFDEQMQERQHFHYPPFTRIIYVYLRHRDNGVVGHAADDMAQLLRPAFGDRVLGPETPVVARVSSLHIRKIMLKILPSESVAAVRKTLYAAQQQLLSRPYTANLYLYFDVDPV